MSEFVPRRIGIKYLLTELAIGNVKEIPKRVILFKNILNIYHYNICVYIYMYLTSNYFLNQITFSVIYLYLVPVDETFFLHQLIELFFPQTCGILSQRVEERC